MAFQNLEEASVVDAPAPSSPAAASVVYEDLLGVDQEHLQGEIRFLNEVGHVDQL